MFDSMSLDTTISDLYDCGVNDDLLFLLDAVNRNMRHMLWIHNTSGAPLSSGSLSLIFSSGGGRVGGLMNMVKDLQKYTSSPNFIVRW